MSRESVFIICQRGSVLLRVYVCCTTAWFVLCTMHTIGCMVSNFVCSIVCSSCHDVDVDVIIVLKNFCAKKKILHPSAPSTRKYPKCHLINHLVFWILNYCTLYLLEWFRNIISNQIYYPFTYAHQIHPKLSIWDVHLKRTCILHARSLTTVHACVIWPLTSPRHYSSFL